MNLSSWSNGDDDSITDSHVLLYDNDSSVDLN